MRAVSSHKIAATLVILLILACVNLVAAQQTQSFTGPFRIGEFNGKAKYAYNIMAGDTVLNGDFRFEKSDLEALFENKDQSFLFLGQFNKGYAQGNWKFQMGAYETRREAELVDYQYRVLVSGLQKEATGNFKSGKPDGKWNYRVSKIRNSEVDTVLFKSTLEFSEGTPQRSFKIEGVQGALVGRVLRDGLAHDQWSLFGAKANTTENWNFQDGVLRSITLSKNDTLQTLPMLKAEGADVQIINLNDRYLKALQLRRPMSDSTTLLKAQIPVLLSKNNDYYKKIDAIISKVSQSEFLPNFKVKLPYYPFDSLELKQVDSIIALTQTAVSVSNALLDNSQLKLLQRSDKEARFLYKVLLQLNENFVMPLANLFEYNKDTILEFLPRKDLIQRTWPNGKPDPEIKIAADSLQGERNFRYAPELATNFKGTTLASVYRLAEYTMGSLDSIQRVLGDKLTIDQQEQDLVAYEKKLVLDSELLAKRIALANDSLPKAYRKALQSLQTRMEKRLDTYLSNKTPQSRLQRASNLVGCFEQANLLSFHIMALPRRLDDIKEHYKDDVWNPFMANIMQEAVKKRITDAYEEVLIPYFLNQAGADSDCSEIANLVAQMNRTYDRMFALRTLMTKKLERKLKREDNPKTVMLLLNQPLQPIEK